MLAGDGPAARRRLWEGFREDRVFSVYPAYSTMVLKALLGPRLVEVGRVARRRLHLRRRGYKGSGVHAMPDR
jgi:hypothetical protein